MTDNDTVIAQETENDTGNRLSERSGYLSETGQPEERPHQQTPQVQNPSPMPENTTDSSGSGTTFDGGQVIPGK